VLFFGEKSALKVIGVSLPYFETNPTELIFACACHMNATSIFVDTLLA